MNQRFKLGFLLTALVALPIFALGLVGLHALKTDLSAYQLKENVSAANDLTMLDYKVSQHLDKLRRIVRTDIETVHVKGAWALRCVFQGSCLPDQEKRLSLIVSFNPQGDQIYPPTESTAQIYPEVRALKSIASSLSTARDQLSKMSLLGRMSGVWTNYLTPSGHNLLYCWLGKNNLTYCGAIDRDWLISEIGSFLTKQIPTQAPQHIRLIDIHQKIIWQNRTPITLEIAAEKQLSTPLYFWRMEIMKNTTEASNQYLFTMAALTLPITILLIIIALTLFRNQKQVLAEANQRANFAASISHELRTPLTNLQLYADLILNKVQKSQPAEQVPPIAPASENTAEISKYAKVIAAETTRLSELVNNALTITQGNNPSLRQKVPAIPDHVIVETVSRLAPLLKDQIDKISYNLDTPDEILIDKSALQQILVNLLDNCRKYAPTSNIRITTKLDNNTLTLTVRDWGINFSKNQMKYLFKPFKQNNENNKPNQEGFGLGLSVCKQLAQENKGTIRAEKANPGARFIITMKTSPQTSEATSEI